MKLSPGVAATLFLGIAAATYPATPAWKFEVAVAAAPVTDAAGQLMVAPFLGGLDVPRPQLVDINGDGKMDLFVQERGNELIFFEQVDGKWTWRSDHYLDIPVGEWYRFVDLDGDGKIDLLAEMPSGYIREWRNVGSKTAPQFQALGDTIRDVDGHAIVADRQNILNAVDIDCNGKLDLFIGRVQGTVDRFEQSGNSPDGSPRFRMVEEGWQGIEVLGPEATGGSLQRADTISGPAPSLGANGSSRHGANTLTFADLEGKGVLDLFWGDFFEQGLLRFENTGSCGSPNLQGKPVRFPAVKPVLTSGYNAPTFGDVDGDGNIDLVMGVIGGAYGPNRTSIDNLYYLQQAPHGTWSTRSKQLISMIDVGSEAIPVLADLDGDGDLDLLVGNKIAPTDPNNGTITWFENIGTAKAPAFHERGVLPVNGNFNYAPAVVDLDGDGLPDLVVGTWRDHIAWYRNNGTRGAPKFTLADTALVTITRGSNTTPAFADLDGDGLVDLVIGEASGTINLYHNGGSKTAPKFDLVSDHFQDIKPGRRSAPALADMDGDGRPDLLVGTEEGEIHLWINTTPKGGAISFTPDSTFTIKGYGLAAPTVGDLRGIGQHDLLVGTGSGGVRWYLDRTIRP